MPPHNQPGNAVPLEELLAVVKAARALLEDVDAAASVKRGDFYHSRKSLRTALQQLDARN